MRPEVSSKWRKLIGRTWSTSSLLLAIGPLLISLLSSLITVLWLFAPLSFWLWDTIGRWWPRLPDFESKALFWYARNTPYGRDLLSSGVCGFGGQSSDWVWACWCADCGIVRYVFTERLQVFVGGNRLRWANDCVFFGRLLSLLFPFCFFVDCCIAHVLRAILLIFEANILGMVSLRAPIWAQFCSVGQNIKP